MSDIDQKILDSIKEKPGQKAKDIAEQLGVERQQVNSALYGHLKGKVQQDKKYQWYLKEVEGIDKIKKKPKPQKRVKTTKSLCTVG